MPLEIEHKFLVNLDKLDLSKSESKIPMCQAYIKTDGTKTIRVRITSEKAYLTIKGNSVGTTRSEYEYEIPLSDAHEMMDEFCAQKIEKIRHIFRIDGNTWEVDEFLGSNKGLWIAEIELETEDTKYTRPEWLGVDISVDLKYTNAALAENPFSQW